jgi:phosphatidate cytidylyltransferase
MSDDDLWRQQGGSDDDDDDDGSEGKAVAPVDDSEDDWEDFGELSFADDVPAADDGPPLRLGADDTGGLPHWTEPPTGEMPKLFGDREPTDDLDVWASISQQSPVWQDERVSDHTTLLDELGFDDDLPRSGAADRPVDDSLFELTEPEPDIDLATDLAAAPRYEPVRAREPIRIGTDPTGDDFRPAPSRGRGGRANGSPQRGRPAPGTRPSAGGRPGGPAANEPAAAGGGSRDMPMAVALGLVLAAAFVLLVRFTGTTGTMALVVVVLAFAAIEFYDKATERGYRPAKMPGVIACAVMPLAAYWQAEQGIALVVFLAICATVLTSMGANSVQSGPLPNTAITMLGIMWIGVLGSFAAMILKFGEPIGTDTLFAVVVGVVANDVGALFVGSAAGRTPLREWISPHKTVEGLIGGIVATVGALVLVNVVNGSAETWPKLGHLIVLGVVIAVLAPIGDLTESMFKRNLDIKDFGTILPGHGGVLDRFDGFLFVLPGAYYVLRVIEPYLPT